VTGKRKRIPSPDVAERAHFPTRSDILTYIETAPDRITKREIARAFGIKGSDRIDLKRLLKEMEKEGLIFQKHKKIRKSGTLPPVTVVEIVGRDDNGEYIAHPSDWIEDEAGEKPRIVMAARSAGGRKDANTGIGDQVLARLRKLDPDVSGGYVYEASIIKKLQRVRKRLLGIYRRVEDRGGLIDPIDKKHLKEWPVRKGDEGGASAGELVEFEVLRSRSFGDARAKVTSCLGNPRDQKSVSLIAIHSAGIPDQFPQDVIGELDKLSPPRPGSREDLRHLPLITIDPTDARDHDDAVWAEPDSNPANVGGWIVIVAIADVAHYVRPNTTIDREARRRGNSVYFPDRVVPMLPEILSNGLCSLKENEDRTSLAVRMIFNRSGKKVGHTFIRAIIRTKANLSYQQFQKAIDEKPDRTINHLYQDVILPLWSAYQALKILRDERGPLDLDLPERKIVLDDQGQVKDVHVPPRLEAHRLIEEFMIQANVSAAETLDKHKSPMIYRVHEAPSREKLIALKLFLQTLNISLSSTSLARPAPLNQILEKSRLNENSELIGEVILRSQSQAEYSPENVGHFGLNLRRYTHFTSPIRRYSDLLIHRALIRSLKLGSDGLSDSEADILDETAQDLSALERRAMSAERETIDRLIAQFLAEKIGATFPGTISGVTKSGLFVRLKETGADGFISAATMNTDYFQFDETSRSFVGEHTGLGYRLGDRVDVRLVEAIPSAGALRFTMLSEGKKRIHRLSKKSGFKNRSGTKFRKKPVRKRRASRRS